MTALTLKQKECLTHAKKDGCVRVGDGYYTYPKQTIHKLIREGLLSATEYFNQYVLTSAGRKKINRFRKDYTPECLK